MNRNEIVVGYSIYLCIAAIPILNMLSPVIVISAWAIVRFNIKLRNETSAILMAHLENGMKICIRLLVWLFIGFFFILMNEFVETGAGPSLIFIAGIFFASGVVNAVYRICKGVYRLSHRTSPFNKEKRLKNAHEPELLI